MSNAARIDELRIKFEENPRRYFAPLANEYRKAGDLAQAIALCREHLPKQPGHMSGYIVFGQALYESGELDEARDIFEQALDLDPENLIALRHLGDIARASGDALAARRWYERVLDADPRNDDIAAQLATLVTVGTPPSVAAVVPAFDSIARVPVTPAVPMTPIGFGVMPTPDSVMRAVDMDAVNASMPRRTPIDLDAIESEGAGWTANAVAPVDDVVPMEEAPLEPSDDSMALVALQPSPERDADAFAFPDEPQSQHDAALPAAEEGTGVAAIEEVEESFEEGLIAAAWPDTTELVARVLTPRVFTPRFVTPLDSATIHDTVSAFGREPSDPLSFSFDRSDATEPNPEAVAEQPVQESVADPFEDAVEDEPDSILEIAVPAPHAESDELPWLAMSTSSAAFEELGDEEPGLQAIAEAFAEDARAAGNEGPMTVAAMEDVPIVGDEESFADVARDMAAEPHPAVDASQDVDPMSEHFLDSPVSAHTQESAAPAFVTETMGELLFSQGFLSRAVDVYEELVRRRPFDPVLASRLTELRDIMASTAGVVPLSPETPWLSEAPAHDAESTVMTPTPDYGTPAMSMPYLTPRVTPYAQPSVTEEFLPRRSAREWFASIAARRVPRRTPPQSAPAVDHSPEGLATLFGNETSAQDDAAAKALADAFAPVSAHDLESGSALDFEFARSTPVFSPAVTTNTPLRSPSMTPPVGGNAGFSFDRFFPDPATHRPTPAAAPIVPDAPVTDDLAQFSVWLKGLGNS